MTTSLASPATVLTAAAPTPAARWSRWRRGEVVTAYLAFAIFAVLVLAKSTAMLEPDDFAYRASIVALSHGQILLTNTQYLAISHGLAASGGQGIMQWHHTAAGMWISEKNPGYPFFAVIFYLIGLLRVAPLFYGAIAALGLYHGARAWLGRWAGALAVSLFLFSGAALVFAWRATMPTFTDASLIAAAAGGLLWVVLSPQQSTRRRAAVGLLSFAALEGATFIRYTDVVELIVAVVVVSLVRKRAQLSWLLLGLWASSILLFAGLILGFDRYAYGHATATGYSAGEITFSTASFWTNLTKMPRQLTIAMPIWILAAIAIIVMIVRSMKALRDAHATQRIVRSRDLGVGLALLAGWAALWGLYLNYTWTVGQLTGGHGANTVHVVRFYLPVLGLIALLATWLLRRLTPPLSLALIIGLFVAGVLSFQAMSTGSVGGPGGGLNGPPGSGPGIIGPAPQGVAPSGVALRTGSTPQTVMTKSSAG